ncbi:hypothetical protein DFJ73DRAFT_799020 [Zopfochytrium polystomum]|nr:hypothetical protein DFJ73DRAFT_799020 [Zopfochytrium polystomum]
MTTTMVTMMTTTNLIVALWLLLVGVLAGIPSAEANPFLSTPNDKCSASGSVPTRFAVACPITCVSDVKNCPKAFVSTAIATCTQTVCLDGSCQADCTAANQNPVCTCSRGYNVGDGQTVTPTRPLYPCNLNPPTVNVPQYLQESPVDTGNANKPLWNACTALANANGTTFLVSQTSLYLECAIPPPSDRTTHFAAPEFLIAYAIVGVEIILLLFHSLYKRTRESSFRDRPSNSGGVLPRGAAGSFKSPADVELADMSSSFGAAPDPNITFLGYRLDPIGTAASTTVIATSIIWIILLAILTLDYYAVFAQFGFREESDMIFYDHSLLSKVFIVVWHFVTFWFLWVVFAQPGADSRFGRRVPLASASFVVARKRLPDPVALANQGAMVDWVRRTEVRLRKYTGADVSLTTVPVLTTSNGRRYIEFECARYVYDDRAASFVPHSITVGPTFGDVHRQRSGLRSGEARDRLELVGPNAIVFPADTFITALFKEFSGLFYVYQMMMLWIWFYYAYYYMALVLTAVIVVSGVIKVLVFLRSQKRVLDMASFSGSTRVLRDGTWSLETSENVVPGDIIQVTASSEHVLTVDAVLIEGGAVCDESSLTGEALPVVKAAIRDDTPDAVCTPGTTKNSALFAGCHILEVQPTASDRPVLAVVTATGAQTSKGRLVKDILFPTPVSFVFIEHLKIVFPLLVLWGFLMLLASIAMLGTSGADAWFYGMFTISQVLSPLLPAVLVIGQSVASERLAKQGILCVDLDRITLCGKAKVFCFDKTGTLTKEGLDFMGVQAVESNDQFGSVQSIFASFPPILRSALSTCHSVASLGGSSGGAGRLVGNFVDIEMFRATGASLTLSNSDYGTPISAATTIVTPAPATADRPLRIIRRFEFVHGSAYMTAVVQDAGGSGPITVFMKGGFEKIRDLVAASGGFGLPPNYDAVTNAHANAGVYTLAIASRVLPNGTTVADVMGMSRAALEAGAQFAGLCLFRNELKHDTADALDDLRDAGCRLIMCTGDAVGTGVYIARACGMVRGSQAGEPVVVVGDVESGAGGPATAVVWRNTETGESVNDTEVERLLEAGRKGYGRPVELAVTGRAFNALLASGRMRGLLFETRVFARMSPEDKVQCVRLHMEKAITVMCGDGGNDAGALKAAHAGIALSEAESSVVSHFSSRNRSLSSCVALLKEARCSLDISFASYKFLIMYGEILTFVGLVQYYFTVNMGQWMWILIDGCTIPLSWGLTQAQPAPGRLSRSRPTARLLGPETIASVCLLLAVDLGFLIFAVAMLYANNGPGGFLFCNEFDGRTADVRRWWELADNFEGEVTGLLSAFQIVGAALAWSLGSPHRASVLRNWRFLLVFAVVFGILTLLTLAGPNSFSCLFRINCGTAAALQSLGYPSDFPGVPSVYHGFAGHNVMPVSFRFKLWFLACANIGFGVVAQGVGVLGWGRAWAKRTWPLKRLVYRT